jgi:hypothetical protein
VTNRQEEGRITLPQHQGRQVPVDVIEIGQAQEGFPAKGLEAAAGVVGRVSQETATDPVADPGGDLLGGAILPANPLAAHQGQVLRAGHLWRPPAVGPEQVLRNEQSARHDDAQGLHQRLGALLAPATLLVHLPVAVPKTAAWDPGQRVGVPVDECGGTRHYAPPF